VLTILAVVAVIASTFLPKLSSAFEKRNEIITNNFESNDTLIIE
jgi:F0F1-type ATP synthase membrane subunit b/b'